MAHYAFLDDNNVVTEVIPGIDETILIEGLSPEVWYGNFRGQVCKRTSYHSKIRFNYAGKGFTYNPVTNAFIAPKPICGHTELLLNNLMRWECAACEAEAIQRSKTT